MKPITYAVALAAMLLAAPSAMAQHPQGLPELPPMPEIPEKKPVNSVPLGNADAFEEVQLDIPIVDGPFKPNWESIEGNYPGTPDWLRDGKFGIWVHFGPQAAGESGDWYARHLYKESHVAYANHQKRWGHPSEAGYKEVLRDWNPTKLDPEYLTELYQRAGARFLMIQGVHHDNFDLWNSQYHPWNSVNMGPKRDLLREWADACKKHGMRYGVTFHHEYTWWWWQTAFMSDTQGAKKGVPYDGNLTLEDGVGQWWEGYDPRRLYGIDLREYQTVHDRALSPWSPPDAGIFWRHLDYCKWYATEWALRIMDVTANYDPDFIYTDGTVQGPFTGNGTGTGYKCNAMQTVMADFYNRQLKERGKVDAFSIIKFRSATNGTATTEEFGFPGGIRSDQEWIREAPIGDWFYAPGFVYHAPSAIRYIIEAVSRDGNAALNICFRPDGSIDPEAVTMLEQVGDWMRVNGEAIYGSHAWKTLGEGEGGVHTFPGGGLGAGQANTYFSPQELRYTVGKDGTLYGLSMGFPEAGSTLTFQSLGLASEYMNDKVVSVTLLGYGNVEFEQGLDQLTVSIPADAKNLTCPVFRFNFAKGEEQAAMLDDMIQAYEAKLAEMEAMKGYNTGKVNPARVAEFAAAIEQARASIGGDEARAVGKLKTLYREFSERALNSDTDPVSKGATDITKDALVEASAFSRTSDTNNGRRFGAPLNWTVENFDIPNGNDGTKHGIDGFTGANSLMLGVWDDRDRNTTGDLHDARLYRRVRLQPGRYYFGAKYNANYNLTAAYIFASTELGTTTQLPQQSLAYWPITKAGLDGKYHGIFFTITEEQEVYLGFQADLTGAAEQELRADAVMLRQYKAETYSDLQTLIKSATTTLNGATINRNTGFFAPEAAARLRDALAAASETDENATENEITDIYNRLSTALSDFKAYGLNPGGAPDQYEPATDETVHYLIEAKDFARKDPSVTTRFSSPLYWTVENFLMSRGSEGTKNGIDKYPGYDCLYLGVWGDRDNNRQGSLANARIYQTVTLPAGRYYFGAKYETLVDVNDKAYIFVADKPYATTQLPKKAIAYHPINKATVGGDFSGVFFTLEQEQEVALGFQANLTLGAVNQEFRAREVSLLCYEQEDEDRMEQIVNSQLSNCKYYDLLGRRVASPRQHGIYIFNGKKVVR